MKHKRTNGQQDEFIFDRRAGMEARDEAIERVDENADPVWKDEARLVILELAQIKISFTTDDVWEKLVAQGVRVPHERRAMGAVMLKLAREGVIQQVDDFRRSVMAGCHRRKKQTWIGASLSC